MKPSGSPELGIHVLVIDPPGGDSLDLASQLAPAVEGDLSIDTVSGLDSARARIDEEHVDCVVCRHDPPGIDGVEVLAALRGDHADLPVLLATDADAAAGAISGGATDVVTVTDGCVNGPVVANRLRSIATQTRDRGKYEQIFAQANDGIVVHDADGDILEANERLYRMLGHDPDRASPLTYEELVVDRTEYTESRARELIRTAAESGGHTVEWLIETAAGEERWVEVSHKPVSIGGADRVLAFVRDITERKENERLLRDREQQLEAIFNHPASFAVVLDARGRVLRANRPALDHVDADPEDVDGVPLWETPWWPDVGAERERIRDAVELAVAGRTIQLEADLAAESGTRSLDLRFDPIDTHREHTEADAEADADADADTDDAHRSVVIGYDITKRKERERQLRESRQTLRRFNAIAADPDLSFAEQVERLLELGRDRLDLDIAYLSRIDETTGDFEILHAQADHDLIRPGVERKLASTYCRRTVESESPLGIANAGEEIPDDPVYREVGLECYLGDEIVVDGELYGTLCFADETPRSEPFSDEERTLIDIMAQWLRRGLEERKYRNELEESRSEIEKTLERVDDAFFALDDDWRVTYVNEAGADVLRGAMQADYDDAELIGRHLWEEVPEAVDTTFYEAYHRALEEQESVSFEEYYDPLDVWFEVQAYPDSDGISVYFTDITERKERERELERLHDLLDQTERIADIGGWEIEADGTEAFWTEYLFELLGIDRDEEPSIEEALAVYHDDDRGIVEDAVEEATRDGEPFDVEVRFWKSDDELRWLRVQGVPVVEDGEVVRIRGAAQDVTEQKQREETLGRLLRTAQQLIRAGTVDDLLDAIVDGTDAVFGYGLNSVRLHDPDEGTLPAARISPDAHEYIDGLPTYADDEGLPGRAFQSGEATLVSDTADHPELDYEVLESAMFVPLGDHGLLGVGALEPDAFDEDDVALVELLALVATGAFDRLERESEMRQLQRIVEHVDEMGFLLDDEDRFAFVTDSFASYVGRDADALVGERLPDMLADADISISESLDGDRDDADEANATLEVHMLTANGRRPVELELSRIGGDDAGEGYDDVVTAGVVTDITELASTRSDLATERERFQELFENLPDPVVEVEFRDGDPIVEYLNPAFTEVFDYDAESVRNRNINDFIVPDRERRAADALDEQAMGGEQARVEVQRETNGGYRDFLLRYIPYPREDGMYAFAVYTDITDQKERERYLQVMHRVLRHNLRNDINVVLALARRLRENVVDEELAAHAGTLEENAEDIASLSEKAKEIERVIGRRSEGAGTVDAAAYLRETVASFRESHPEASLEIDVPEPLWVRGTEDLKRAFEELVENALEHSDADTPELRIDAERGDSDIIQLRFHDNGPGIPAVEWGVITGETDISQLNHGSGLGLWLVRWLIEAYGGEISREARGDHTTVVVALRRARPTEAQAESVAERAASED